FILEPQIIAAISNAVAYANPNLAATALVRPDIRDNPGIYPPPEVKQHLFFDRLASPDYDRLRTRAWTKVKTGT
ncbi:MAG TPA: spermidine/putrescine ABC transporter substrate-binding protein PotF, partial [Stellaceae bacterium]|nr:spermidine/putrescine ABC transporter substrate-binding protein PotF [Stellaceae bacterium]